MKTVLIVAPRMIENEGDVCLFPLGLAYVSGYLKSNNIPVVAINLNYVRGTISSILSRVIADHGVGVVMTGGLSVQYSLIYEILQAVKSINKDIVTVVGGGIITSEPTVAIEALEHADIGVIGEGELTSLELLKVINNQVEGNLSQVDGIIFKQNNRLIKSDRPRKEIRDLDSLPWPDYDGFNLKENSESGVSINGVHCRNSISMISSRSCPYSCTFCFHTTGRIYRRRSFDNFFSELDYLVSKYKAEFLFLYDELFSTDYERLEDFCRRVEKYNIKWSAAFRVNDIIEDMLPLLKRSGCVQMGFGIESADNTILKSMRKKIKIEDTENALALAYKHGIMAQGNLIFGDSEETYETASNSLKWWHSHREYSLKLGMIIAYPGTAIYKQACDKGIIKDKIDFLRQGCPQLNLSKMTDAEFSKLQSDIYLAQNDELKPEQVLVFNKYIQQGRVDISGVCPRCKSENNWLNVKIFTTNRLNCETCKQRLQVLVDEATIASIENNISMLLKSHDKIGLWGMAAYAVDAISKMKILSKNNIYLIDISETAQNTLICGKPVHSPDIISAEMIDAIIVLPADYYTNIKSTTKSKYPSVRNIFNISNLI